MANRNDRHHQNSDGSATYCRCGLRPYQASHENPVCAYTLIKQKDFPNGQKLFACSRCKETYYKDRESQLEHWKTAHRYTCCSLENDDPRVLEGFKTIQECFDALEEVIDQWKHQKTLPKGRLFLHAMKELGDYSIHVKTSWVDELEVEQFRSNMSRFFSQLESIFCTHACCNSAYCPRLVGPDQKELFDVLWSVPGFANYFLSSELFLSTTLKSFKENGIAPPEKHNILVGDNQEIYYDAFFEREQIESDVDYCVALAAIHMWSAMSWRAQKARVVAIMRNAFDCWTCPYVRSSFPPKGVRTLGAVTVNRASFFERFVTTFDALSWQSPFVKWLRDDEILPGLTLKALLSAIMEDESCFMLSMCRIRNLCANLYEVMVQMDGNPKLRKHLAAEDRWDLLKVWVSWKPLEVYNVNLGGNYCNLIIGNRSGVAFELYNVAKNDFALVDWDENDEDCMKRKRLLSALVESRRTRALKKSKPLVAIYTEVMQLKYENRMEGSGMDPLPFPEDAEELIAEFAAEELIDGA
jgi:hypothetical protein